MLFSVLILTLISVSHAQFTPQIATCSDYESQGNPFSIKEWRKDNTSCTRWKKVKDLECDYDGKAASYWERDCSKASPCAEEFICMEKDPNTLKDPCTKWWQNTGAQCYSEETGLWEQHWSRACTDMRLNSVFCSDTETPKDD